MITNEFNTRILVVDDDEGVRRSILSVLEPAQRSNDALAAAAADLFGEEVEGTPVVQSNALSFEVVSASSGRQAVEIVEQQPSFALAFMDIRMPGMDGLTAAEKIRELDPKIELVFLTAYSDFSLEDIQTRAGIDVAYHCKPFAVDEIRQLATKGVFDWNHLRDLEELIGRVGELRIPETELQPLLQNIQQQVSRWLGSHSSLLVREIDGRLEPVLSTGVLLEPEQQQSSIEWIAANPSAEGEIVQRPGSLLLTIGDHRILQLLPEDTWVRKGKQYLLTLFLEQAASSVDRARLYESLARERTLAIVGRAASGIAHDLRNHLSVLTMANEMLSDGDMANEMFLELTTKVVNTMTDYTAGIVELGRPTVVTPKPVQASDLFSEVATALRLFFAQDDLLVETAVADASLFIDQTQFVRVLLNLGVNAGKAMSAAKIENARLQFVGEAGPTSYVIRVIDNGPGIPEDLIEELFEPFVSGGAYEGSGLGCAIAKQIVDAHDGTISVTSVDGTEFVLEIPNQ